MPLLGLVLFCCSLGVSNRHDLPLEVIYKGKQHELSKFVQEQQGEVDCYV